MATSKRRRLNTVWVWVAAAIAVALVFYLARLATRTRIPVRTATVERSELKSTIATNGKVEPQVNFEAHAPFAGVIRKRYVHEGQHVTEGTLLIAMDDTDAHSRLAAAQAAMRSAQATYNATLKGGTQEERLALSGDFEKAQMDRDQAQRDLDALKKLQLTGAASANEVAVAQQRLAAANTSIQTLQLRKTQRYDADDVARARSAFEEAEASYAAAQSALNQANVHAPFAGTVYSIPVSTSEYVQQGDRLLQMADLSKMQVRGYFDEPEIGKLHVGQPITIEWDARPGQVWHGHVARVPSTIITYGTRNVGEVLVTIDDADENLLPNTNVRITVTVANEGSALNIPREALHTERGQSYVFRVVDGVLHRTPVTVGNLNLTQAEILTGLHEGDVVALGSTNGQPLGDRVLVVESK
ncbi:MAG TPA: efflux RND transporter periplasmic adaptor subunit [Silvibacterium sp.]|jgi:HlyD family secretion protein|nr:efflux RND transporter periplasmic adaptor subunit [Silvibacterium sp.]